MNKKSLVLACTVMATLSGGAARAENLVEVF